MNARVRTGRECIGIGCRGEVARNGLCCVMCWLRLSEDLRAFVSITGTIDGASREDRFVAVRKTMEALR